MEKDRVDCSTYIFLSLIILLGFVVRFIKLSDFPPALYVDEALVGYNAFSLLHDLRDEAGDFLPLVFRAWGTYTAPLQYYLAMVGTFFFGLNEFGTRFHSAFLGSLTVPLTFFVARKLTQRISVALLSALFLALSPWHIHQSRMAVETTASLFFFTLGIYFFLRWRECLSIKIMIVTALSFVLTFYAYHTGRLTSPLILIALMVYSWSVVRREWRHVLLGVVVGASLILPLAWHAVLDYEKITARPRAINVFADQGVPLKLWEDVTSDGNTPAKIIRFFHNKLFGYAEDILWRYVSHFEPSFLFTIGDPHERFEIPNTGLLLLSGFILVPFGLWKIVKLKEMRERRWIVLSWILIPPVVSSLAFITPNSYHMLESVVPWAIVLAFGFDAIIRSSSKIYRLLSIFLFLTLIVNILHYTVQYTQEIPLRLSPKWAYGFKEVASSIQENQLSFDRVIFSNRVYILMLYYWKYPPQQFRQEAMRDTQVDQWGFEHVRQFGKYEFATNFSWDKIEKRQRILYVVESGEIPDYWTDADDGEALKRTSKKPPNKLRRIKQIFYPNGEEALELIEII